MNLDKVAPTHRDVYRASMLKLLAVFLTVVSLNAAVAQERQLRTPPLPPGMVQKVAVTNVQTAMRTILVMDVSTSILSDAANGEKIAYHFRALADVFAAMPTNGTFAVEHLKSEFNRFLPPAEIDLASIRASILSLYERTYEYRSRADLPPLEFLSVIARTFNEAIREGIRQGGKGQLLQ